MLPKLRTLRDSSPAQILAVRALKPAQEIVTRGLGDARRAVSIAKITVKPKKSRLDQKEKIDASVLVKEFQNLSKEKSNLKAEKAQLEGEKKAGIKSGDEDAETKIEEVDLQLTRLSAQLKRLGQEMTKLAELVEISAKTSKSIIRQLHGNEAVHEAPSKEFRATRTNGGPEKDKTAYALVLETAEGPVTLAGIFAKKAALPVHDGGIKHTDLPGHVGEIKRAKPAGNKDKHNTFGFYSISSNQDFGGTGSGKALIVRVRETLKDSFALTTVSPVRGFHEKRDMEAFFALTDDQKTQEVLAYLMRGKDPVASFHLGNGAYIGNIHFNADDPDDPVTINYVYPGSDDILEANQEHKKSGLIVMAPHLYRLASQQDNLRKPHNAGIDRLPVPENANRIRGLAA